MPRRKVPKPPLALVYVRVSTERQASNGHGLDAQEGRCKSYVAAYPHLGEVEVVRDAGVSGSVPPAKRPGLSGALARLAKGEAQSLVVLDLSRLGRRAADVVLLAEEAKAQGWGLVCVEQSMDTTTAHGKFVLLILAAVGELERGLIRERTKAGLASAKAKGRRLGRPILPATRAAGSRALLLRAEGLTWEQVAQRLVSEGLRRTNGREWDGPAAYRAAKSVRLDQEAAALRRQVEGVSG